VTIYAIGDIHGALDQLRRLLDKIAADAAAHGDTKPSIVFLGDYIDRGPDSKGVLDLLSSGDIEARFAPIYLMGNHDLCVLSILRDLGAGETDAAWRVTVAQWMEVGGRKTMESYGIQGLAARRPQGIVRDLLEVFPPPHMAFLSALKLTSRSGPWLFTHAGINPARPWDKQTQTDMIYGVPRFMDSDADFGVTVVCGHWNKPKGPIIKPNMVMCDTGAGYFGGKLSAVALVEGEKVRVLK